MQSQDHMKLIPRTICHGEVGGPPMLEAEASGELSLHPLLQGACRHLRVPWFQDEDRQEWKQVHDLCITSKLQQD